MKMWSMIGPPTFSKSTSMLSGVAASSLGAPVPGLVVDAGVKAQGLYRVAALSLSPGDADSAGASRLG